MTLLAFSWRSPLGTRPHRSDLVRQLLGMEPVPGRPWSSPILTRIFPPPDLDLGVGARQWRSQYSSRQSSHGPPFNPSMSGVLIPATSLDQAQLKASLVGSLHRPLTAGLPAVVGANHLRYASGKGQPVQHACRAAAGDHPLRRRASANWCERPRRRASALAAGSSSKGCAHL